MSFICKQESQLSNIKKGGNRRSERLLSQFIDSTYVAGSLIEIEGYSPDFLSGYDVEEYDLSLEAGRNAKGTMHLSYIATKYKIILKTTPLLQPQLTEFYSHIPRRAISVKFFNPYTGQWQTIQCYRGDRKVSMLGDWAKFGKLYDETELSLIEL